MTELGVFHNKAPTGTDFQPKLTKAPNPKIKARLAAIWAERRR